MNTINDLLRDRRRSRVWKQLQQRARRRWYGKPHLCAAVNLPDDWPGASSLVSQIDQHGFDLVPIIYQSAFDGAGTCVWTQGMSDAIDAWCEANIAADYDGIAVVDHEVPTFARWRSPLTSTQDLHALNAFLAAVLSRCRQRRPAASWGMFAMPRKSGTTPDGYLTSEAWREKIVESVDLWEASDVVHVSAYVTTRTINQEFERTQLEAQGSALLWGKPTYHWLCPRFGRNSQAAQQGRPVPDSELSARLQLCTRMPSKLTRGFVLWDGFVNDTAEERDAGAIQFERIMSMIERFAR